MKTPRSVCVWISNINDLFQQESWGPHSWQYRFRNTEPTPGLPYHPWQAITPQGWGGLLTVIQKYFKRSQIIKSSLCCKNKFWTPWIIFPNIHFPWIFWRHLVCVQEYTYSVPWIQQEKYLWHQMYGEMSKGPGSRADQPVCFFS